MTLRRGGQAYAAGRERALFYGYCHGENGNSKRPHIPNMATQNPLYLFHSFAKFAEGECVDFVLSNLAKSLTLEDRANLAVCFSKQRVAVPAVAQDSALSLQGHALFQRACLGCHGDHAQGMETMPRLAGRPGDYLRKALNRCRNNDPSWAGSVMIDVASKLSEAEIEAVATYLSQLTSTAQQERRASAELLCATVC